MSVCMNSCLCVCVCVLISKLVEHNAWPSPRCHFDSFACVVTPRVLLSFFYFSVLFCFVLFVCFSFFDDDIRVLCVSHHF